MLNDNDILQLRREVVEESYYEFFLYFWDTVSGEELVENWHLRFICDELQKVGELAIARKAKEYDLVINVPPGSSKSTLCTILFPVWLWVKDPTLQIISSSWSSDLSLKHATDSREVIRSEKFQRLFGGSFDIRRNEDSKGFYRNTQGGYRLATSTGANVTGQHGHIILCDDLLNPKGAKSEPVLSSVNEYLNKTMNSRKVDKRNTPTILIMQRLHENDPTGDWLEKAKNGKKALRHICLPASTDYVINPPELATNYQDGLFDPVRMPRSVLEEEQATLGSMDYAGQYGQSPMATEGNKVKRSWWRYIEEHQLPNGLVWELWIDGAYTNSTANDPCGFMVLAYHKLTNTLYMRHACSKHMEMPELLAFVPDYAAKNQLGQRSRTMIEPKASGKSLGQLLRTDRSAGLSPVEIKSHLVGEGKEARMQCQMPKIEAGQVVLVKGSWNEDLVTQICSFPNAAHDEYVDLLGYAVDDYFSNSRPAISIIRRQ